uniref:F-box C protein n=1 Tax=Caenorhabditis tropicalis TaxID=1561998 RepID=A0A1I7TAH3_9PELO
MNSKPLTYDSLKTVIQYMDPNTRILLSSRVPSIAKIEKLVPLRIKNLVIGFHNIRINETSYGYEIYQVDSTKNVPVKVSGINLLNHKLTCDVDEFGIRDYITKAGGMLPGNTGNQEANLFGEYDREVIPTDEGRLQKLERILETQKRYLLQCRHPNNILGSWNPNFREYESIEDWEEKIKMMEHELLPFQNRRNNIRPKFEIHVTKRQEDSPHQVIERVNYTGDLHKAEERIFQFMFSKRCIKIPMSNSTVLKISYRESEESDDDDYIIEMAVVAEK